MVANNDEEVKLLSVYILKYWHAEDEIENKTWCSNVPIRGGLTQWVLGQCPAAHNFMGPTPINHDNLKRAQIMAKLLLPRGPRGSQSTPGTDRITYNENLKLVDFYGLDSVLIDGWTGLELTHG